MNESKRGLQVPVLAYHGTDVGDTAGASPRPPIVPSATAGAEPGNVDAVAKLEAQGLPVDHDVVGVDSILWAHNKLGCGLKGSHKAPAE